VNGTEAAFWLGLRVKRGADIVSTAAPVLNHQTRNLCGQFWFALRFEKLPKLYCERRERMDKEQSLFSLLVHGDL
jgi:hypothetical protein